MLLCWCLFKCSSNLLPWKQGILSRLGRNSTDCFPLVTALTLQITSPPQDLTGECSTTFVTAGGSGDWSWVRLRYASFGRNGWNYLNDKQWCLSSCRSHVKWKNPNWRPLTFDEWNSVAFLVISNCSKKKKKRASVFYFYICCCWPSPYTPWSHSNHLSAMNWSKALIVIFCAMKKGPTVDGAWRPFIWADRAAIRLHLVRASLRLWLDW